MPLVSADFLDQEFDVCVVGAGPAGLSCAFACHEQGLRVLLLEAGNKHPVPGSPDVIAAEIEHPDAHDPVEIVAASALGGSSHWWGGRSTPLDVVDFRDWPISWTEMLPWWRYAAKLIGAGSILHQPAPGKFGGLDKFEVTACESWASNRILARRWRKRIHAKQGPAIVLRARVTNLRYHDGSITSIDVETPAGSKTVTASHFVLTCGGLGCVRLLLNAQQSNPSLFGGPDGPLGRGYMGHLTGSIAEIVFDSPENAEAFNFYKANDGYVARRRILPTAETVTNEDICNIALWLDQPARGVASHGSAVASARFLAGYGLRVVAGKLGKASRASLRPHFANVGKAPLAAIAGLIEAAWVLTSARLWGARNFPCRFLPTGIGAWRLVYHAEQKSRASNRLSLAKTTDSAGLPKLHIDFCYSQDDCSAVVRAHELLDEDLRKAGAGLLRWSSVDPKSVVMDWARDGYHQLGGTRMSEDPASGVVDKHCRVHGLGNLWIASGSVFPSGGQANPTLTIIALAIRVADQIGSLRRSKAKPATQQPSFFTRQRVAHAARAGQ